MGTTDCSLVSTGELACHLHQGEGNTGHVDMLCERLGDEIAVLVETDHLSLSTESLIGLTHFAHTDFRTLMECRTNSQFHFFERQFGRLT